jgi:hypothetical protein
MSRRSTATAIFAGAIVLGVAGGWLLARKHDHLHRHDLFAAHPWQRFAALGWIASKGDAELLPVLHDYLAWEPVPALRQRARRVIDALGATT